MDLTALISLLRANGVRRFKDKDIEIEFEAAKLLPETPEPSKTPALVQVPDPPDMPPDLKADDLMNHDKVLLWSASPDPSDTEELPLTGDAPIEPPESIAA